MLTLVKRLWIVLPSLEEWYEAPYYGRGMYSGGLLSVGLHRRPRQRLLTRRLGMVQGR
ncbi:MAG: hypothetical protein AAF430_09520 [Myxococcota bacterium]